MQGCRTGVELRGEWTAEEWRIALSTGMDAGEVRAIRGATARGLPFGTATFVRHCEDYAGRTLTVRAVGRPKKAAAGVGWA